MKKADYLHRILAKAIDFIIAGILASPGWVGVLAGALYIAISDGFFHGQSVGKKLIGLRIVVTQMGGSPAPCTFKDSIARNFMFSIVFVLSHIPLLNWVFVFALGIPLLAIELYFIYYDDMGARVGDILAGSKVVNTAPKEVQS